MADPTPTAPKPPLGEAIIIGLVALILIGLASWWSWRPRGAPRIARVPPAAEPARGFVGARACRDCHPGEYAAADDSGHARTLRPAARAAIADWLDGRSFPDPERTGVTWAYRRREGRLIAERSEDGQAEEQILDFALGSGRHATTFVSMTSNPPAIPTAREHRLTYFAHSRTMALTPGQQAMTRPSALTPLGRELTPFETFKCLDCHATRSTARDDQGLDLASLIPNVTCERCHGPGREHVAAARRGGPIAPLPFGPDRASAAREVRLCGGCHRLPEMAPSEFIRPENDLLVRFQPIGLLRSECYKQGAGRLRCTTCHDPHARSSRDQAAYVATCLDCHGPASKTSCPVSPRTDCLGCHMPRRESSHGMRFTDHWIRVRKP